VSQRPLDVLALPLRDVAIIEASAGTGKTYTITRLHLRLVVEAGLTVDRILVVTYTVAATDELRARIRALLVEALAALDGGPRDAFLDGLLGTVDEVVARQRITAALHGFDEASVFTIHGFCQRVLADGAFESGTPFDTEVITDERELVREICDDFWRQTFHDVSPLLAGYLVRRRLGPDVWQTVVSPHLGRADLAVMLPSAPEDCAALERACLDAFDLARRTWRRDEVATLLSREGVLNKAHYKAANLREWLDRVDVYLAAELPDLKPFKQLEKFARARVTRSTLKNQVPPAHPFFDACDDLWTAVTALESAFVAHLLHAQGRLIDYCRAQLAVRKRHRQVQSFDDLLSQLDAALRGPRGAVLAGDIRERWQAALIDEFQDTDPVQYGIFRAVYGSTGLPVFLVGDPKQAIYSFRGADIFAYLAARRDAHEQWPLDVNWRSDPRLIEGVNAVFGGVRRPFVVEEIPFHAARAAEHERTALHVEGDDGPPLRIWFMAPEPGRKQVTKAVGRRRAARATAASIAGLLEQARCGEARLGERAVDGGDVAVLVRTHREGTLMCAELLRLGVPSVQQAQDSVFVTREAAELERVLLAVAEPGHPGLLRAALATELLGVDAAELLALAASDAEWTTVVETFYGYRHLWRERGFSAMLRTLLDERGVAMRLLSYQDGERRLTNVLHLAELLQEAAVQRRGGIERLVGWMAERRQADAAESEEQQLRLESDEHLVKIVTVHKSKGLEYPIVYCPFVWDGMLFNMKAKRPFAFHDPDADNRPTLHLAADDTTLRDHAMREELAENLRLFYVALTRAKHRCTLVTGRVGDVGTSALAWLLHTPDAMTSPAAMGRHVRELSDADVRAHLDTLVGRAGGAIRVEALPEQRGTAYRGGQGDGSRLQARRIVQPVPRAWGVVSFSALAAGRSDESPDHDANRWRDAPDTVAAARDVFGFPKGARAGSCLHRIFELQEFTSRDAAPRATLVEHQLRGHGIDPSWTPVVSDMVERVLTTPLDAAGRVRLCDVPRAQRLEELEFYYPLARFDSGALRALLATHELGTPGLREAMSHLGFEVTPGFMKGFVDLVFEADGRFWVLDWKSNWLGATVTDYAPARLEAAIARDAYWLQYLVYTVMLHRLLRLRLRDYDYDRHVGGVFYVFLRGVDPVVGPGAGVFHDRPSRALIEALDHHMQGMS
jgi:exodeoxyribonuclease V beta subunit